MDIERLLQFFPKFLRCRHGEPVAWFVLGATNDGWEAGYFNVMGEIVNALYAEANTPLEALEELYRLTQVIDMLRLPAVLVDETLETNAVDTLHWEL